MVPKQISDCISRVLRSETRKGETTKQGVVLLAMNEMSRRGDFGLPPAMLRTVAHRIYSSEVDRQLKSNLPENVVHIALRNAPPELVQVMSKLPAWIAIGEGPSAPWVPSLQATAGQWTKNAELKDKKAKQTENRARASQDLARYLSEYGIQSLSEAMSFEEAAE